MNKKEVVELRELYKLRGDKQAVSTIDNYLYGIRKNKFKRPRRITDAQYKQMKENFWNIEAELLMNHLRHLDIHRNHVKRYGSIMANWIKNENSEYH